MFQDDDYEKENQGEVCDYNPQERNDMEYPQGYELEFGTLSLKKSKQALEYLRDNVINTYFTSTQPFQGYNTEVILDEEDGEYVLVLTLQLDTYYNQYIVYSQYKFKPSIDQIESYTYLTDLDGSPTRIQEKPLRLLVGRYFFRLNNVFRLGAFSIHPFLGYIKLKMSCATGTSNFNELIQTTKRSWYQVTTFIREVYQTSHYSNNFHLYKTLYQANKMNESIFEELKTRLNPSNFRPLPPQIQESEKELEEIVIISFLKEWKPKSKKGQEKIIKYNKFFISPKQVPIAGMDTKIHSPIDIRTKYAELYSQTQHKDNFRGKGGFSDISLTEIKYAHKVKGIEKLETRKLIAKLEREDGTIKIQREKDIITHLAKSNSGECPYIAKFYLPIQNEYKGVIFMEYYNYKSLEHFKQHQAQIQTLNTKLYIIYQLALGIKFLKDANVIHLDLKPANILVSKNMIVKIIDFGEAIIKTEKQINPGHTMPYAPPEMFDTNRKLNQKSDIFSFGMIAYEFFFDVLPVDFRKHTIPNLVEAYQTKKVLLKSNKKDIENQGPKKIIGLIRAMFLLCLSPNAKQRPYIEWVIIFTRLALQYLDNLY